MTITASAHWAGKALRQHVDVNGRHTIVTDEPERLGGEDSGPAPLELLPATLAACIATMISLYAKRKGWDVGGMAVDVEYDDEASPRSFEVVVRLPENVTPEQLERFEHVARTCPARRAMEAGFSFEERFELEPGAGTRA